MIPARAIAGVDALAAAWYAGLRAVRYNSRKPPAAWRGTQAERVCDLSALDRPVEIFRGSAREAARLFPQNANVAAKIARAGIGFEATECSLNAHPAAEGNVHIIEADGAFGRLRIEVRGNPLAENPKTSMLGALAVVRAIRNRIDAVVI